MPSRQKSKQTDTRIAEALRPTIAVLASAHGYRDPFTAKHQHRVAALSESIGNQLGLSQARVEILRLAAIMHDIGKIYVPAEIISKPGALNEAEYALMKTHCAVGHDILQHLQAPNPLAEIVFAHHERMDGSGYPRGLAGDHIVMEARILAVADIFDAMTSNRAYRPGVTQDVALDELQTMASRQLDGDAVAALRGLILSGVIAQSVTQPAVHSLTSRH
jgi:putative nucleotidyltransferase with HDIG domain